MSALDAFLPCPLHCAHTCLWNLLQRMPVPHLQTPSPQLNQTKGCLHLTILSSSLVHAGGFLPKGDLFSPAWRVVLFTGVGSERVSYNSPHPVVRPPGSVDKQMIPVPCATKPSTASASHAPRFPSAPPMDGMNARRVLPGTPMSLRPVAAAHRTSGQPPRGPLA